MRSARSRALALLSAALAPGVAHAQELTDAPATGGAPIADGGMAAAATGAMLWVYLGALALSLALFLLYFIRREQQRRALVAFDSTPAQRPLKTLQPLDEQRATLFAVENLTRQTSDNPAQLTTQLRRALVSAAPGGEAHKECPSCQRRYASWMSLCPFDHTPLRSLAPRPYSNPHETPLGRHTCPTCQRRYHMDAHFCPHDGDRLVEDTREASASAPEFLVCRSCGRAVDDEAVGCSCSDSDPIRLDPKRVGTLKPALPMTACPRCHAHGALGQVRCEHDGELLLPVDAVQLNTFPSTGHGPRRKFCNACGTRFGGASEYCCYDGARLRSLN